VYNKVLTNEEKYATLRILKKNKNIHTELTRIVSLYGILAKNIHTDFLSLSLECRDLSLSFLKSGRNCLTSTSKEHRLGWKGYDYGKPV
jgi:hypothetical protein